MKRTVRPFDDERRFQNNFLFGIIMHAIMNSIQTS